MEIKINYHRDQFNSELEHYIKKGKSLYSEFKVSIIDKNKLDEFTRQLKFWNEEVKEFLNTRLGCFEENPYLSDFKKISLINVAALVSKLKGDEIDATRSDYEHLLTCTLKKVDILVILQSKSKFIKVNKAFSDTQETTVDTMREFKEMREIFISHSSKDREYVEQIINIFESIGVPSNKIFCSSFEGYGVALGDDFLLTIKEKLDANVLVIFILSQNFYSSPVCLCEMGATWIKTNSHIPILIPPSDFKDVKGVIPTTNGMKINEKLKYNSLKEIIEKFFQLHPINNSIWERKRDYSLKELEKLLKE